MIRSTVRRGAAASTALFGLAATASAVPPCVDGLTEVPVTDPPTEETTMLTGVVALAPDDIWAVGRFSNCYDCGPFEIDTFSLTMHFDGTGWSVVPSPSPPNVVGDFHVELSAVDAVGSDLAYAAGSYVNGTVNSTDTFVLRWDGTEWTQLDSPGVSSFGAQGFGFSAVRALSPTEVWFGGSFADGPCSDSCPTVVRHDGTGFDVFHLEQTPDSLAPHRIYAIDGSSPDEIWAVGASGGVSSGGNPSGRVYAARWDGSSWARLEMPPAFGIDDILYDVAVLAAADVWVSGSYYDFDKQGQLFVVPLLMHWDGDGWTVHEAPVVASSLVARASDDVYGVGADGLVHWDGSSWSLVADPLPWPPLGFRNLVGLAAVDDCRLVGVGLTSFGPSDTDALVVDVTSSLTPCPADLDGSGAVGFGDLLEILGAWAGPEPDLDGDGLVGFGDLVALLAAWGPC